MRTDFEFSNLVGTVYGAGNVVFTPNGESLLSPVGNRVTIFNLVKDSSITLPFTHRTPISRIAIHPNGKILLSADTTGRIILSHITRKIVLYHFSFRFPITSLQFSPNGTHFAVAFDRKVEIWFTPDTPNTNNQDRLDFAPFVKYRTYTGHFDEITNIQWSSDSRFFITSSKDLSSRIFSLTSENDFVPTSLTGHRSALISSWFSKDQEIIWTISKDGALFKWIYEDEKWLISRRHYLMQSPAHVTCSSYHSISNLMFIAFSSGKFTILDLETFTDIQSMSISQIEVTDITINPSGTWIAIASAKKSQLIVWDWQSESYILKQQSHHDNLNSISYTPDGQRIVSCADDGKVKLWDTKSGFCSITFTEHTSSVTACKFAKNGTILFTSSLDGSIRAWDLLRYRNFRVFTAPTKIGWNCLGVDESGEIVAAASTENEVIYLWSTKTGQLLDQLAGHEGPISSLSFTPDNNLLLSGSWDNTVRLWNIFARNSSTETIQLQANIVTLAIRSDSKQYAVSTLDGQLTFWDLETSNQVKSIDNRNDVSSGRKSSDRKIASNITGVKFFTTLSYSVDGICLLAAGKSKYICLYEVTSGILLKKFTVSINLALDGIQEFLNSKLLHESGQIINEDESDDSDREKENILPGIKRVDPSVRQYRPEIKVSSLSFSPTGKEFCTSTTEGILIYKLDVGIKFDPFDLDIEVTPEYIVSTLKEKDYLKALIMGFKLNSKKLLQQIFESIPVSDIRHVVSTIPETYLARLIHLVILKSETSPHLEFCLIWIKHIISSWGSLLREKKVEYSAEIRKITKILNLVERELRKVGENNIYEAEYLLLQAQSEDDDHDAENGIMNLIQDEDHSDDKSTCSDSQDEWIGISDS